MNPAIHDTPDAEQYAGQCLRELLAGTCDLRRFVEELPHVCAGSADTGWALLALIDQYLRRGQIDMRLFQAIKIPLQRQLLGLPALPAMARMPRAQLVVQRPPVYAAPPAAVAQTPRLHSVRPPPSADPGQRPMRVTARCTSVAIGTAASTVPAVPAGKHRASWLLLWCTLMGLTAAMLQRAHWFPQLVAPANIPSRATASEGVATLAATAAIPRARPEPWSAPAASSTAYWSARSSQAARRRGVVTTRGLVAITAGALAPSPAAAALPHRRSSIASRHQHPAVAGPAPLRLSATAYTVSPGQNVAAITVRRVSHRRRTIHFVWWTASDSAQSGVDFSAPPLARASLPAAADAVAFTIPVHPDPAHGSERRFFVLIGIRGDTSTPLARASVVIKPGAVAGTEGAGTGAAAAFRHRMGGA